jgi:hypothetical protein
MFVQPAVLDELVVALDRLNATDLHALTPTDVDQAMLEWERFEAKAAAFKAKLCRRFELDREWATVGAQRPGNYLATKLRVPSKTFSRQFSVARRQAQLPAVEQALAAGDISPSHRDKILAIDNPRVHDALVADHEQIVGWAKRLRWKDFEHALARWLEEADEDGPEPSDLDDNRLDLSQSFGGRWRLDGNLDPIGGGIVAAELRRLEDLEFKADWADARQQLGREPQPNELRRTPKQRRAAALLEMARRSATGPEEGRRGAILLSVFVGIDALRRIVELDNGTVLTPGQVVPWLDEATFETLVFATGFRDITASTQRTYRGALRRAVLGRDRECFHEYCDAPASHCQVDHYEPASKGGATTAPNGQGSCPHHNQAKGDKDPTELGEGP